MGKLGYIVLGLALVVGALAFAGYRHLAPSTTSIATRSAAPTASRSAIPPPPPASGTSAGKTSGGGGSSSLSGLQLFEMGLNVANVLVGVLGIWMTMRGMRAERRAMALRRDR